MKIIVFGLIAVFLICCAMPSMGSLTDAQKSQISNWFSMLKGAKEAPSVSFEKDMLNDVVDVKVWPDGSDVAEIESNMVYASAAIISDYIRLLKEIPEIRKQNQNLELRITFINRSEKGRSTDEEKYKYTIKYGDLYYED